MISNDFMNNEANFLNQNFNNVMTNIVIPTTEFMVNYRIGETLIKKQTFITAEKIDFKGLIQIRLAEKDDHTKVFISSIDTSFFTQLKKDQSLHVTFSGFVDNLVKIFNECKAGNLQISLIREKSTSNLVLQFYEIRSFKNLIHLCLPIKEAPLPAVLFYINQTVKLLQKQNESYANNLEYSHKEIERNAATISQLQKENEKLRISLKEQENYSAAKHKEEIFHLQETIKKVHDERDTEIRQLKQSIGNLQNELEHFKYESSQLNQDKSKHLKRIETLNEEICVLKSNIANLKEQNEKLHGENASFRSLGNKNEMYINELKRQIQEMRDKVRRHEKTKSELLAEIEAEKKLCHSKRTALDMATEEISKANGIISKQVEEISKLKKAVDWRTEVALKQEAIIEEKDKQLEKLTEQLIKLQNEIKEIRKESEQFFNHLGSVKDLADKIEYKYSERIRDFNKKLSSSS